VSDAMECVNRVTRVLDRSGASRFVDEDTGEKVIQLNNPSMRTEPGNVALCGVANYSITINSCIATVLRRHCMSDNIYRVVAISRKTQKKVVAYMGNGAIEATDAFELLKNNEGFMNTFRVRL
ncbi:hypothetical protein, partial [Escherichia coli]